jgi:hypothetical protein
MPTSHINEAREVPGERRQFPKCAPQEFSQDTRERCSLCPHSLHKGHIFPWRGLDATWNWSVGASMQVAKGRCESSSELPRPYGAKFFLELCPPQLTAERAHQEPPQRLKGPNHLTRFLRREEIFDFPHEVTHSTLSPRLNSRRKAMVPSHWSAHPSIRGLLVSQSGKERRGRHPERTRTSPPVCPEFGGGPIVNHVFGTKAKHMFDLLA